MGTNEAKKHYAIPLKLLRTIDGSLYTAGAKIYSQRDGELIKVASFYINAVSKFKASLIAIEQLLNEVPDGSSVSISGQGFGTEYKRIVHKPNISSLIIEKRLNVYTSNSPILRDRAELFELCKDAQNRKRNIVAEI